MDIVQITEEKLQLSSIIAAITVPEAGAVSSFSGNTRNNFNGKKVARLEYEGYIQMAEKEMKKICNEIRKKWDVLHISLNHRLGIVPVIDTSVIVAISSVHRRESLEAVHFAIDEIKAKVPIWKKEYYEDGTSFEWKENSECCFKPNANITHNHLNSHKHDIIT